MKCHEDLEVWKKSVDLSINIYTVTKLFPKEEMFGLTSQMRRAAVSIPSNIAEGAARKSPKEFVQFLSIAAGSASELSTQLVISRRLGYSSVDELQHAESETNSVSRMLQGLIRKVKGGGQ